MTLLSSIYRRVVSHPPGLCLLFLFTLFSLLSLCVCDLPIVIPSQASGPFKAVDLLDSSHIAQAVITFNQPAQLAGRMVYAPSPLAGLSFFNESLSPTLPASAFDVPIHVILPHTEDSRWGCEPFKHTANDLNETYAGRLMLIERRGGCNFQTKAANVLATGALGLIIHNCATCEPGILRIGNVDVPIPLAFISMEDGYLLRGYLESRTTTLLSNSSLSVDYPGLTGTLVGTGPMHPDELNALKAIASKFTIPQSTLDENSVLRNWNTLFTSSADPCSDRLVGVWCERGRVHSVYLKYLGIDGVLDKHWGNLTNIKFLTISENVPPGTGLSGPVPSSFCQLRELMVLSLEANALTTLPDCLGNLTNLYFGTFDRNSFAALPSTTSQLKQLVYLNFKANKITALPLNMNQLNNLAALDFSQNPSLQDPSFLSVSAFNQLYLFNMASCSLTGALPAPFLANCSKLQTIDLSGNKFTGALNQGMFIGHDQLQELFLSHNQFSSVAPTAFDNLPSMTLLDISYNSLTGSLPNLSNLPALKKFLARNNGLTGGIPASWGDLPSLNVIVLSYNQLSEPLAALSVAPALTSLSLDNNAIITPADAANDVGALLYSLTSATLLELYIQNNQLTGGWQNGWTSATLNKLNISTNQIENLPSDLWTGVLTYLDVSNNKLAGALPDDINNTPGSAPVTNLYLQGNPNLVLWPLPSWLDFLPGVFVSGPKNNYECQEVVSPPFRELVVKLDAASTLFHGCECKNGTFGYPPNCVRVPVYALVSPHGVGAYTPDPDANLNNQTGFASVLQDFDSFNNITLFVNEPLVSTRPFPLAPPFTDDWYGQRRLTVGLSTIWTIDVTSFRLDTASGIEGYDYPSTKSSNIGASDRLQPVRVIWVRIHLSKQFFNESASNSLAIHEGDASLNGERVQTFSGRQLQANCQSKTNFTKNDNYVTRYNQSLGVINDWCVYEVPVRSNQASLFFTSRATENRHFVATYSYQFDCVPGLPLSSRNVCDNPESSATSVLGPVLGVAGALLAVSFGWVLKEKIQRERQKAEALKNNKQLAEDGEEVMELDAYLADQKVRRIWELKKELLIMSFGSIVELVLTILTWVSVGELLNSNADGVASSNVTLAYVTIAIVSLMAFIVNSISRGLAFYSLYLQLSDENDNIVQSSQSTKALSHDLQVINRKIIQLKIIFLSLIFDTLPLCALNIVRVEQTGETRSENLRFIFQACIGGFLIGMKISQLLTMSALQRRRLEVRYQMFAQKSQLLITSRSAAQTRTSSNATARVGPGSTHARGAVIGTGRKDTSPQTQRQATVGTISASPMLISNHPSEEFDDSTSNVSSHPASPSGGGGGASGVVKKFTQLPVLSGQHSSATASGLALPSEIPPPPPGEPEDYPGAIDHNHIEMQTMQPGLQPRNY